MKSPCSTASTPSSKAGHRSRKIPTQKQAFAGPPGSSQSSVAGMGIPPPSRQARSRSKMVSNNSMLWSPDGASKMCACPSAKAGTNTPQPELFEYGLRLRRTVGGYGSPPSRGRQSKGRGDDSKKGGDGAGADMRDHVAEPEEADRRHAGQNAVDGVTAALEWHPHKVGAGFLLPLFHEHDQRGRGRRIRERAGMNLGIGGKLGEALDVELRAHAQRLRQKEKVGDRLEAVVRVVGQILELELVVG